MASSPKNVPCPVSHLGCGFVSSSVEDSVRHYKEECKFSLVLCSHCGTQVGLFTSLHFLKQWCSCKATSPSQDQQGSSKSVLEQLQSVQQEQRSFREWMKEWTAGLEARMMKTVEERVNTKLDALTERMEHLSKNEEVMRKLAHMDDTLQDTNAAHEFLLAQLRADVRASKRKQDNILDHVDQASKVTLQELKDSKELSLRNVEEFARDKFDLLSNKVDEVKEEISRRTNVATLTELDSVVKTSSAALHNLLTKLGTDFLAVREKLEDNARKIDRVSEAALCASRKVENSAKEVSDLKQSVEEVKKLAREIGRVGREEAKESSNVALGVSERHRGMEHVDRLLGNKAMWCIRNVSEYFMMEDSRSACAVTEKFSILGYPCRLGLRIVRDGGGRQISLFVAISQSCSDPKLPKLGSLQCTASLIHPESTYKNRRVNMRDGRDTPLRNSLGEPGFLCREMWLCTVREARMWGFIVDDAINVSVEVVL